MNTQTEENPKANAAPEKLRIESVKIEWLEDDSPDLSWLDQTDDKMGEGFEKHANARKESYGGSWAMLSCRAIAQVSRDIGQGCRRLQTFSSGGLYGIASDSDKTYLAEIENQELYDLVEHLGAFGINTSAKELREVSEQ